jgi:hypothetical protein
VKLLEAVLVNPTKSPSELKIAPPLVPDPSVILPPEASTIELAKPDVD